MATEVTALPEDALAGVFRALPMRSLATVRCVCKAWRDVVDDHTLLLPHFLPSTVRGVFINYIDHDSPHHFARPCSSLSSSSTTIPRVVDGGMIDYKDWWSVLDHCSGLLLCEIQRRINELYVCNPATRRWTVLPPYRFHGEDEDGNNRYHYAGAYMVFDPAASPHYQVVLIPEVPWVPSADERRALLRKKKERHPPPPFHLAGLFSSPDDGGGDAAFGLEEEEEEEELEQEDQANSQDEEFQQLGLMEWPPTLWELRVFSSITGGWEKRAFVRREGTPAAGIVEKMWLESLGRTMRRRHAVYHHGSLFVHCQGAFVTRLALSNHDYQIIETPANIKYTKPYLGKLQDSVCFGIVHNHQLKIWILNESCGQMEWLLKYEVQVGHYARYVASLPYGQDGSWIVEENNNWIVKEKIDTTHNTSHNVESQSEESYEWESDNDDGSWTVEENNDWLVEENNDTTHNTRHNVESQSKESYEWDSDNDDTFTVDSRSQEGFNHGELDIMGFHPYKEVIFLVELYGVVAYHLNSFKIQYLGHSRPKCYYHNHSNGIYESFLYTPCMIGHLLHGDQTD